MRPIFTTSATAKPKAAKPKATAPIKAEVDAEVDNKIMISAGSHSVLQGTKKWVGVNCAIVLRSQADPRMLSPQYGNGLSVRQVTDAQVEQVIDNIFRDDLLKFVRMSYVDYGSYTFAVFKQSGAQQVVFVDTTFNPPGVLWTSDQLRMANSNERDKVSYLVAPFVPDAHLYESVLSNG